MRADAVTEETRRAFDWRCEENACMCQMHWRKAVYAKGNTDPIDPTFVKNRSSQHKEDCPRDIERIVRENSEYTTLKNGQIHVRVNFPLGSSRVDRFPLRGYLTEEMKKAAENQKDIQPYSNLADLVKFIEKNFGGLESESAGEIVVNYQGRSVEWSKLFKGSDAYDKLYYRSTNFKKVEELDVTSPIMTIVRLVKELEMNERGKRRFECEEQRVKLMGRRQKVVPVIVCDDSEPALAKKIEKYMNEGAVMIVSARPFHPGFNSPPSRMGEQRISMLVHKVEQVEAVDAKYWKPSYRPGKQLDLFIAPTSEPALQQL